MAKCIHGNDIDQCGFCRRNRHIEQFGGNHKGPVFAQLAVGEFALLPFKDVGAQASSDDGFYVQAVGGTGEIEYLIFELD